MARESRELSQRSNLLKVLVRKRKRGKKLIQIEVYSTSNKCSSVLYLDCLIRSAEDRKTFKERQYMHCSVSSFLFTRRIVVSSV